MAGLPQLVQHLRQLVAPHDPVSDGVLLDRYAHDREEEAFAALVARHGPMVLRVCQRAVPDPGAAEDCFQATFLILARKADSLRRPVALAGWLHGVALRVASAARKAGCRRRLSQMPASASEPSDPHPDPLAQLTARELLIAVDEEVQRLPEVYRLPVILCCLENLSKEETARRLGWTVGSVKARLERGRKRLGARLAKRGLTLSAGLVVVEVSRGAATAAVGPGLKFATTKAALTFAAGVAGKGAETGATATVLAGVVLKSMAVGKWKALVAITVTLGAVTLGAGALVSNGIGDKPSSVKPPTMLQAIAQPETPQKGGADKPIPRLDRSGDPLPPYALARLGSIRFRTGNLHAIALSPEGKICATAGLNSLSLWDIATGKELRRFGRVRQPLSIAFTPDGTKLIAPGLFKEGVLIWDVKTGNLVRELKNSDERFGDVAVSPDGKIIAGLSERGRLDRGVSLWDAASGQLLRVLRTEDGNKAIPDPGLLVFSPDGETLATRGPEGVISLWNVVTGEKKRRLAPEPSAPDGEYLVKAFVFSPDGKTLASGGSSLCRWDVNTGKQTRFLPKGVAGAYRLAYSPDGKMLASAHFGGMVRIWDMATAKELVYFQAYEPYWKTSTGIAFTSNGQTLLTSGESAIRLWDVKTGKEINTDRGHTGMYEHCIVLPDKRTVITANWDGTVRQWDADTGKETRRFAGLDPALEITVLSPEGSMAASYKREGQGRRIRLYDLKSAKELGALGGENISWPMTFSPDGKTLFANSYDEKEWKEHPGRFAGYIRSWDVATRKEIRVVARHEDHPHNLTVSRDGKRLAFMAPYPPGRGSDSSIYIHDTTTGAKLCQIPAFSMIGSFAFSPDGKTLALAHDGKNPREETCVEVWDIAKGKKLRQLAAQSSRSLLLALSPDGKTLVTSGFQNPNENDIRIHLWEFTTGGERLQLSGHTGGIRNLVFAENSRKLVSTSDDSTALVWDLTGLRTNEGESKPFDHGNAWNVLADADAAKAYAAIWSLTTAPDRSVAFLRDRLRPVEPTDAKVIAQLVLDLDTSTFAVRQKAAAELFRLGELAAPALEQALAGRPALEQRQRVEQLLNALDAVPTGSNLQKIRAVEVLEHIGTPEARDFLRTLATGAAGASLTVEARASLQRLHGREQKD